MPKTLFSKKENSLPRAEIHHQNSKSKEETFEKDSIRSNRFASQINLLKHGRRNGGTKVFSPIPQDSRFLTKRRKRSSKERERGEKKGEEEAWSRDDLTSMGSVSLFGRAAKEEDDTAATAQGLNNGARSRAFSGRQLYNRLVFYGRFMNAVLSSALS